MITSVALNVHGGGLLDVEHIWVEEADIAHTFAGNVEPFVCISLDKHVQRLKIDFEFFHTIDRDLHLPGLMVRHKMVAFSSMSVISFWCLMMLLLIILKSSAKAVIMILVPLRF